MTITLSSISGGVTDNLRDEDANPDLTFPNAVNEGVAFVDAVGIGLDSSISATQILSVSVTKDIESNNFSLQNISAGTSLNDVILNTPNISSSVLNGLNYNVTIEPGKTFANIAITGSLSSAFADKYFSYTELENYESITVNSINDIPTSNARIFLYKPSFNNYALVKSNVIIEYDTGNIFYNIQKRLINDWESNRLALKNRLSIE